MRNFLILLATGLSFLVSCKKTAEPVDIVGEWQLSDYQTKAVTIGSEKVDIYVQFSADKSFSLYQMLGSGRYKKFSGTYAVSADNVLSGTYSGGGSWASTYYVSLEGSKLILTILPEEKEVQTFTSTTIPESVKNNIY